MKRALLSLLLGAFGCVGSQQGPGDAGRATSTSSSESSSTSAGSDCVYGSELDACPIPDFSQCGCSNGLLNTCDILSPGEQGCCGSVEVVQQLCPHGCADSGTGVGECQPGGSGAACPASVVTAEHGTLENDAGSAVAVLRFVPDGGSVVLVATNAATACAAETDAGIPADAGAQTLLILPTPPQNAGVVDCNPVCIMTFPESGAQLVVWKNGVATVQTATSGTRTLSFNQNGGQVGTYDLMFGSAVEQGSFVAPACGVCPLAK